MTDRSPGRGESADTSTGAPVDPTLGDPTGGDPTLGDVHGAAVNILGPTEHALPARVLRVVIATLVVGIVPVFLTGALSGPIGEDLQVGAATIGLAVSAFFLASAVVSVLGGRIVDRVGAGRGLKVGMAMTVVGTASTGLLASEGWHLAVTLAITGSALSFVDPGIARAVTRAVGSRRQGTAFGIKESAVPVASMVAGLTLPLLGAVVGWQVPFLIVSLLAVVTLVLIPSDVEVTGGRAERATSPRTVSPRTVSPRTEPPSGEQPDLPDPHGSGQARGETPVVRLDKGARVELILLSIGGGIAGGLGAAAATFLVPSAVLIGLTASLAGPLLSLASVVSIFARLGAGRFADRRQDAVLTLLLWMVAAGAIGLAALAIASAAVPGGALPSTGVTGDGAPWTIALLVVGAILMIGPGWGWTGLAFLTATQLLPSRPAQASGAILAGLATGGAVAPYLAGAAVEAVGFALTWAISAVLMVVSVVMLREVRRRARQRLAVLAVALHSRDRATEPREARTPSQASPSAQHAPDDADPTPDPDRGGRSAPSTGDRDTQPGPKQPSR
ncbi:MAG: MFS transporter [Nitriliruptoraceae bacterium]